MAPTPDDPADKFGLSVGPAAPSKELTDFLSYIQEAVAPDLAKQSSTLPYSAGGPQACLASPEPPLRATQYAQPGGSQFQQVQLDEIVRGVWVIQESIKALVGPALARVAAIIAPYEDCIARVQQFSVNIQRLLASPEVREFIEHWQRNVRVKQALDRAGWLLHPTIPDEIVLEALDGESC